jgi:hypothetical protein
MTTLTAPVASPREGEMMPILVFCAGNSARWAEIAIGAGMAYGCRSDYRPTHPVTFADLNWRTPDLDAHLAFVRQHRPHLAVAPDVLSLDALPRTLAYAERLAEYAQRVIVVPKCPGVVAQLPEWIVIGYSVPTRYGAADPLLLYELGDRPVHLLGGSPMAQQSLAHYVNVYSADGNATQRAAEFGTWFDGRSWKGGKDGMAPGPDLPYRAFARSCQEVVAAWRRLTQW